VAPVAVRMREVAGSPEDDRAGPVEFPLEALPVRDIPEPRRHRAARIGDHVVVGNDGVSMELVNRWQIRPLLLVNLGRGGNEGSHFLKVYTIQFCISAPARARGSPVF